jgi:hypothetical protein
VGERGGGGGGGGGGGIVQHLSLSFERDTAKNVGRAAALKLFQTILRKLYICILEF